MSAHNPAHKQKNSQPYRVRRSGGLVAGFAATVAATVLLQILFLGLGLLDTLFPHALVAEIASNPFFNGSSGLLYFAVLAHFAMGLFLGVLYSTRFEPRTTGTALKKGLTFSLIPWIGSVLAFFPLIGFGVLGYRIAAGPLAVVMSLALHLVYGAALGLSYALLGEPIHPTHPSDSAAKRKQEAYRAARGGALGLLVGATLGCLLSMMALWQVGLENLSVAGMPPSWLFLALIYVFCSLGLLTGLWTGANRTQIFILNPKTT